jgi:protein gp37
MAFRLQAMGMPQYTKGFELAMHEEALRIPLTWKKPQVVFVNSMSDLFHKKVPASFIQKVFATMRQASWHQFQILTKRAERLAEFSPQIEWPENVWMGVTVEMDLYKDRIDWLRETGARIKFLSLEPLLGPIPKMNLKGIDWVIVGGESGPGARPMDQAWVLDIQTQCKKAGVPFFFKQWGGVHKKKAGRLLQGRTWDEMPRVPPQTIQRELITA